MENFKFTGYFDKEGNEISAGDTIRLMETEIIDKDEVRERLVILGKDCEWYAYAYNEKEGRGEWTHMDSTKNFVKINK